MGQALFNPPNVAGWPGGASWINSSAWLERVNFCNALLSARDDAHTIAPPLATILDRHRLTTAEAVVDHFGSVLLDGQMSPSTRSAVLDYMTRTPLAAAPVALLPASGALSSLKPAFVDQKVRGAVYLLMASPEYQLA